MQVNPGHEKELGVILGTFEPSNTDNFPQMMTKVAATLRTHHLPDATAHWGSLRLIGPLAEEKVGRKRMSPGKGILFCVQHGNGHLMVDRTVRFFIGAGCWGYIPPGVSYQFEGARPTTRNVEFRPVTIRLK